MESYRLELSRDLSPLAPICRLRRQGFRRPARALFPSAFPSLCVSEQYCQCLTGRCMAGPRRRAPSTVPLKMR